MADNLLAAVESTDGVDRVYEFRIVRPDGDVRAAASAHETIADASNSPWLVMTFSASERGGRRRHSRQPATPSRTTTRFSRRLDPVDAQRARWVPRMGSISLKGLGEPIREVRELVKDVRGRNKRERRLQDVEYAERLLKLIEQSGRISGVPDQYAPALGRALMNALKEDRAPDSIRLRRDLSGLDPFDPMDVGPRCRPAPEKRRSAWPGEALESGDLPSPQKRDRVSP